MSKAHIKKENKVKYVKMEIKILIKISHPLIVQFHFSFQDSGMPYHFLKMNHHAWIFSFYVHIFFFHFLSNVLELYFRKSLYLYGSGSWWGVAVPYFS